MKDWQSAHITREAPDTQHNWNAQHAEHTRTPHNTCVEHSISWHINWHIPWHTVSFVFLACLALVTALVASSAPLAHAAAHSATSPTTASQTSAAAHSAATHTAAAHTRPHPQAYTALAQGKAPAIITLLGLPEEQATSPLDLSDEQLCDNLVAASADKPSQIIGASDLQTLKNRASAVDRFSAAQDLATAQAGPLQPQLFAARLQKCTLPDQYEPLSSQEREQIINQASATADEAVQSSKGTAHPLTRHELHYCVATRGSVSESLEQFENKIFRTLNSPEGWPRAGVTFRFAHAASGSGSDGASDADTNTSSGTSTSSAANAVDCDFTLWLSEASQVPSFSSYCSVEYSCRVGNAVIINQSRWNEPTSSWLNGGGNLENYRTMVLNHEVGHRLGHMDNENVCASPNGPAPLMQEQSISLRGCSIRWWPQSLELWTAGL